MLRGGALEEVHAQGRASAHRGGHGVPQGLALRLVCGLSSFSDLISCNCFSDHPSRMTQISVSVLASPLIPLSSFANICRAHPSRCRASHSSPKPNTAASFPDLLLQTTASSDGTYFCPSSRTSSFRAISSPCPPSPLTPLPRQVLATIPFLMLFVFVF